MRHSIKERFINIDTFIISPFLICIGICGLFYPQLLADLLYLGSIGAGVWFGLTNRQKRKRKGL